MQFTDEEIKLVEAHRAKLAKESAAQEEARRKQSIAATLANLINDAKAILYDAKRIAEDNGFEYQIGDMVQSMLNEVSNNQQWYGSDQSLC